MYHTVCTYTCMHTRSHVEINYVMPYKRIGFKALATSETRQGRVKSKQGSDEDKIASSTYTSLLRPAYMHA
jgi:hypothetical protein